MFLCIPFHIQKTPPNNVRHQSLKGTAGDMKFKASTKTTHSVRFGVTAPCQM